MFEQNKWYVFKKGTDIMVAMPANKVHGNDEEVKEMLRIIFSFDDDVEIRANHNYSGLPEGWRCYRVRGGELPKQLRDPITKKYEKWNKVILVEDEPKQQREMKVAKPDRKPAPQVEVRSEGDTTEMVVLPAYALEKLLAQNQVMIEQMGKMMALYELAIQQAGLALLKR